MIAIWGGGRKISQITLKIIELNEAKKTATAGLLSAFNIYYFLWKCKGGCSQYCFPNIFNHGILSFLKHVMGKVFHEIQFGKGKG